MPDPTDSNARRRRRRRVRRITFTVVVIVILIPVIAAAVFIARFNPNAYKPEIEQALERSLGRQVTLGGPLSLALSLTPTISAEDVAIANPPGFSRPEMATLKRLDAEVALVPLLSNRLAIRRIVLVQPEIAIEINQAGRSNLSLARIPSSRSAPPVSPPAPTPPSRAGHARPVAIDVRAIRITDATLFWQNDRSHRRGTLALATFTATAASSASPVKIAADATYAGLPVTLRGETGPLSRLAMPGAGGPAWPVKLAFTLGAADLAIDGSLADPAQARGYRFHLQASLPALEALSPLFPNERLPALQNVDFSADFTDSGDHSHAMSLPAWPRISELSLDVGKSSLAPFAPSLSLSGLSFTAPALDQPCKLTLAGAVGATPFSVSATLGPPSALLPADFGPREATPPPATPWPVAIQAAAAGANVSISGSVSEPRRFAGASLAVSAEVPDLAALAPLAARKLPSLSQVSFSGQIADAETGWRQWVRLANFALTLPEGDLSGDAMLALAGTRPDFTASVTAKRFDFDALRAAFAAMKPRAVPPASHAPAPPPLHLSVAPSPPRFIPDTPLPFAALKTADADLALGFGSLTAGGVTYNNLAGKLTLKDGHLALSPFSVQAPGGHVALTASVDAAGTPPQMALSLDAPALALKPLLAAFGLPAEASGTIGIETHLSGAGGTPHAIAAGLNGSLGMAMAGGSVDNRVIAALLGSVLRVAQVPPELLGTGQSPVRCFAARLDATGGDASVRTLLLETGRLTLTGGGNLALGPETLALRLEPSYQYGKGAISLPVRVGGTFLAPKVAPDLAGAVNGPAKPGGVIGEILGALRGAPASAVPACEPALTLARFGAPGPSAPPVPVPPAGPSTGGKSPAPNSPLNLLRGLFHQ